MKKNKRLRRFLYFLSSRISFRALLQIRKTQKNAQNKVQKIQMAGQQHENYNIGGGPVGDSMPGGLENVDELMQNLPPVPPPTQTIPRDLPQQQQQQRQVSRHQTKYFHAPACS